MPQNDRGKMEKIFTNVLQTLMAAALIWAASTINEIYSKVAALEERTKAMEDIRPAMNNMQLSQEEIKERLIRVEDNQHKIPH